MKTTILKNLTLVLLFTSITVAYAQFSPSVKIDGDVENALTVHVTDLQQMQVQTRRNVKIVSLSGETKREIKELKGVLLRYVLEKARVKISSPKERGKLYIVAKASDGYTVIFTHNEIFNNPTGDNILLVFEEDGKSLDKDGAIVLITTNDKITGPRHIKWLQSIDVKSL